MPVDKRSNLACGTERASRATRCGSVEHVAGCCVGVGVHSDATACYAEDSSMTQISRVSKRKNRNKALPVLSVAGLSVALASAASAVPAGPATDMAGLTPGEGHQITFGEEEISDVTLATFYVFDKENVVGSSDPAVELVGHGHGCGGHGHGCGGCGGHGHHGGGGYGGHGHHGGGGCGGCGGHHHHGYGGCGGCGGGGYWCWANGVRIWCWY